MLKPSGSIRCGRVFEAVAELRDGTSTPGRLLMLAELEVDAGRGWRIYIQRFPHEGVSRGGEPFTLAGRWAALAFVLSRARRAPPPLLTRSRRGVVSGLDTHSVSFTHLRAHET